VALAAPRYAAVLFDLLSGLLDSWSLWNTVAGGEEDGRRWRTEMRSAARGLLLLALIVPCSQSGAIAQSVESTVKGFGLPGTWAPDCAEPPSPLHPHATYSVERSGRASMIYEPGPRAPSSAYAILGAGRGADDKLLLREEWLHDHSRLEVTLRKFRGKVKVWFSRDADGKLLVKDGVVVATGYVSPWMMHCP